VEIKNKIIQCIADMIEELGTTFCTHPNDSVKLFAASRLVDTEIMRRLAILNKRNQQNGTIFVGHCDTVHCDTDNCDMET